MTSKPEIRINFSQLLYGKSVELDKLYNPDKSILASTEQCEEWAKAYRAEWARLNDQILESLHDITGLEFYRDVIDVSLSPYFQPQSDPLIIHFANEPDQFVDLLAHELTHVLLTDNDVLQINSPDFNGDLLAEWRTLFGDHDFNTLVHIPVHAVSKALYLDFMKDESKYERDVAQAKKLKNTQSYKKAWEYVDKEGYLEIIDKLTASYEKL